MIEPIMYLIYLAYVMLFFCFIQVFLPIILDYLESRNMKKCNINKQGVIK